MPYAPERHLSCLLYTRLRSKLEPGATSLVVKTRTTNRSSTLDTRNVGSTSERILRLSPLLSPTVEVETSIGGNLDLESVATPLSSSARPPRIPQTARLSGCSMDALKLVSSWDKGRLKSAALPVTVEGLR